MAVEVENARDPQVERERLLCCSRERRGCLVVQCGYFAVGRKGEGCGQFSIPFYYTAKIKKKSYASNYVFFY